MDIIAGIRFMFKNKPYEVVVKTVAKFEGQWINCIVYKALYAEGSRLWGHVYVRIQKDDEWESFVEAILESINLNLNNLGRY